MTSYMGNKEEKIILLFPISDNKNPNINKNN